MTHQDSERDQIALTILRQGEKKLDAQLQLSIAADQRGSTLAGIYAAAATVLAGWAGHLILNENVRNELSSGLLIAASCFLAATYCCFSAIRPNPIDTAGSTPKKWTDDGVFEKSLFECLVTEAGNYNERIQRNRRAMKDNAEKLKLGMRLSMAAPIAGTLAYIGLSML